MPIGSSLDRSVDSSCRRACRLRPRRMLDMTTLYAPHLQQEDRLRLGQGGAADAPLNSLTASVLQGLFWGGGEQRFRALGWDPAGVTLLQMAYATPENPGAY